VYRTRRTDKLGRLTVRSYSYGLRSVRMTQYQILVFVPLQFVQTVLLGAICLGYPRRRDRVGA